MRTPGYETDDDEKSAQKKLLACFALIACKFNNKFLGKYVFIFMFIFLHENTLKVKNFISLCIVNDYENI